MARDARTILALLRSEKIEETATALPRLSWISEALLIALDLSYGTNSAMPAHTPLWGWQIERLHRPQLN